MFYARHKTFPAILDFRKCLQLVWYVKRRVQGCPWIERRDRQREAIPRWGGGDFVSKSTFRVSPFYRTWWCLLIFFCLPFLHPRLRMPCIFNLTFLPLANISGHPSLSLSSHSSCPFISDDWLRYVPFCVLCWLELKKFQSSLNLVVLLEEWDAGLLGLDLLHERFYLSEQIRCGFIDLCRNNKNSAEDFLSILFPKHPFKQICLDISLNQILALFIHHMDEGRFDGQI